MRKSSLLVFVVAVLITVSFTIATVNAEEHKGSLRGHATDINHDPLVGARVELEPVGYTTASDAQGEPAGPFWTTNLVKVKEAGGNLRLDVGGTMALAFFAPPAA